MSDDNYNPIRSAPRPSDAETVRLTMTGGDHYIGYVKEKNEMLGEPTVYFYVIDDPMGHSGNNLFLKESEIASIEPWEDFGQRMVWL